MSIFRAFPVIVLLWTSAVAAPPPVVENSTLHSKMLMGYQGWFGCPGDGSQVNGWHHWLRKRENVESLSIEMWPDTTGFGEDELYPTSFKLPDGSTAKLFSSHNRKTVQRHFQWMKQYGIDGVLLQRFIGEVQDPRFRAFRNDVTGYVKESAEQQGRVFAIEYDMSAAQADLVMQDWKDLVDGLKITASDRYLRHKDKPVLCLWGLGFTDRGGNAADALRLLNWFRKDAPERYRATLVGGVPSGWREGIGDSLPGAEWAEVYHAFDVISPWTVGRYVDDASADRWLKDKIIPDLTETKRLGIEYMPVVFPGFSWRNLHQGPPNQIPRRGGVFYWHQVANATSAGAVMIKTAMFDEVDEGTAMFKTVPNKSAAPVGVETLTLDADGKALPSDWYLRLAGETSRLLRKKIPAGKFPLERP